MRFAQVAVLREGLRVRPNRHLLLAHACTSGRHGARELLRSLGFEATMVNTGEQVVQLAMEHHFAIILMDVELPVMDGIVATARIRDFESIHPARPRVPVVGCTAHELAKAEPVLLRVGMDAVLQKPWSVLALSACLSRLCPTSLTRDPKTPPCSDG